MKKLFTFIILITLLCFASNAQTSQKKIIDTIPAMLIICDTNKGFQNINNSQYDSNQYEGLLCKYSATNKPLKSINGYIVKELVEGNTLNPWGAQQYYVRIYKYLDSEMRPVNSKWIVQWKTN